MKSRHLLFGLILFSAILAGCVSLFDPEQLIKSNSQVQAFLGEYPNADMTFVSFSENESKQLIEEIQANCGKEIQPQSLYRFSIEDPDSGLNLLGYINEDSQSVICIKKKGTPRTNLAGVDRSFIDPAPEVVYPDDYAPAFEDSFFDTNVEMITGGVVIPEKIIERLKDINKILAESEYEYKAILQAEVLNGEIEDYEDSVGEPPEEAQELMNEVGNWVIRTLIDSDFDGTWVRIIAFSEGDKIRDYGDDYHKIEDLRHMCEDVKGGEFNEEWSECYGIGSDSCRYIGGEYEKSCDAAGFCDEVCFLDYYYDDYEDYDKYEDDYRMKDEFIVEYEFDTDWVDAPEEISESFYDLKRHLYETHKEVELKYVVEADGSGEVEDKEHSEGELDDFLEDRWDEVTSWAKRAANDVGEEKDLRIEIWVESFLEEYDYHDDYDWCGEEGGYWEYECYDDGYCGDVCIFDDHKDHEKEEHEDDLWYLCEDVKGGDYYEEYGECVGIGKDSCEYIGGDYELQCEDDGSCLDICYLGHENEHEHENDDNPEEEIEVKIEIFEDGSIVEVEIDDDFNEFELAQTDLEEIIEVIMREFDLSYDEVYDNKYVNYEDGEYLNKDEHEEDHEEEKEEDESNEEEEENNDDEDNNSDSGNSTSN